MSGFSESEEKAIKGMLAARKKGNVQIVNGRPLDMSKVRAPIVSEDTKHQMYANPRLMLKNKTKPSYEENPETGVEYEWLLKGSYERLARRKDYRPVEVSEVDFDSPFCKLDISQATFSKVAGKNLDIVSSGEFELFETRGESAYLLKRFGADTALNDLKNKGQNDIDAEAGSADIKGLKNAQSFSVGKNSDWAEQHPSVGNISDPSTWGG
jgi:hypothetical protein